MKPLLLDDQSRPPNEGAPAASWRRDPSYRSPLVSDMHRSITNGNLRQRSTLADRADPVAVLDPLAPERLADTKSPALDDGVAVERVEFHEEGAPAGPLGGEQGRAAAGEEGEDVLPLARGVMHLLLPDEHIPY